MEKVNCLQCQYYLNTWDKYAPRGCSVYGIKSMQIPAMLVKRESGEDCMSYKKKDHSKRQKANSDGEGKIDFNDPKYW